MAYMFGRISVHYIVIAYLSVGKYGISSATVVAINMYRSSPSMRSYLMVSIGGVTPSAGHDIRLGDIVISVPGPKRRENGVVCDQHGNTIQAQQIQRAGSSSSVYHHFSVLFRISFVT
jgi:hypothetical protein